MPKSHRFDFDKAIAENGGPMTTTQMVEYFRSAIQPPEAIRVGNTKVVVNRRYQKVKDPQVIPVESLEAQGRRKLVLIHAHNRVKAGQLVQIGKGATCLWDSVKKD